jgi:hypothetical protein
MEFDLWPPPRPSADDQLFVLGMDNIKEASDALTAAPEPPVYGGVVDSSGPQNTLGFKATVTCKLEPKVIPNHVHCSYDDENAGLHSGLDFQHDNPRMLPAFATSRFDLRLFLGWQRLPPSVPSLGPPGGSSL